MNDKNGDTNIETHALKVTHQPEELLNRKSYRSTLSGNPLWSLPDGAIRYVHPLPGFKGGHPLSFSLVYDSMMPYLVKERFPMLPEGFKISGLSCMADVTVDGNASYLYLDGNGVVHTFVPYEDGDSLFHDTEGMGLSQAATYIADHCPYKSLISFMVLTDKIDKNAKKPKTFVEKFSHHIAYLILDQWNETIPGMVFGDVLDEVIGMIGWDYNEKEQKATV